MNKPKWLKMGKQWEVNNGPKVGATMGIRLNEPFAPYVSLRSLGIIRKTTN